MKKLTVTCAMAAVLACSAVAPSATASAATISCNKTQASCDFTKGKLCYTITGNNTCTVTGLSKKGYNASSCTIPSTVTCNGKTYNVTKVAANAFKNCVNLNKINCNNSNIMTNGNNCFGNAVVQFGSSCK